MGQLDLMYREREQRFRQIRGGLTSSKDLRDDDIHDGKKRGYSETDLSEDIWCHIHSLLTLRDAARAACVSHAFQRAWKCYPKLIFDSETLGPLWDDMDFSSRVDHILKKHSGIGVKTFELDFSSYYKPNAFKYLDRWLQIAVKPGIEKLTLVMPKNEAACTNFPCPVLSDGNGSSIWYLHIVDCAFRPTVRLGCLSSLTVLHLDCVQITGDELGCLLSNSVALEQLKLRRCSEITYLEIPVWLQSLSYLQVLECDRLQMLKIEAPNICSLHFTTCDQVEVALTESLRLKNLEMLSCRLLCYAREELPFILPNLETLSIRSRREVLNATMAFLPSKFLHLKCLSICITEAYDYLSLASFLIGAPSLESFKLSVLIRPQCIDELLCEDPPHLRQVRGYRHDKLRSVKISRFYSSKSLVELTSHILENSSSMECLTLDTTDGVFRCCDGRPAKCFCLGRSMEAHKAVLVIGKYIEGKVPSTVKMPCC